MSRNGPATTKTKSAAKPSRKSQPKVPRSKAARIKAQVAFLEQFFREKAEAWARLTPAQRREANAKWARAMKDINETRGYRKVFVE